MTEKTIFHVVLLTEEIEAAEGVDTVKHHQLLTSLWLIWEK